MKVAENKCLRTMGRIFGPAVEKAMPVMLKVALGSVGVLFVAALVLMYSDKRYVEGWTHSESMGFMLMKLVTFLLYLIPIGLRLCKEQALIRIIIVVSCLLTIVFVILVN